MPKLRVEFVRMAPGRGVANAEAVEQVLGEAELDIGVLTAEGSEPTAPANTTHVLLTAVGGQCYVDRTFLLPGKSDPDASVTGRIYIPSGGERVLLCKSGDQISCVSATLS